MTDRRKTAVYIRLSAEDDNDWWNECSIAESGIQYV